MSYGDDIKTLPIDKINNPSITETYIIDTLFTTTNNNTKLLNEIKEFVLLLILYCIFSIQQIDIYIQKFIPITGNSIYIFTAIKGLIFAIAWFLIKNIKFAMKN